MFRDLDWRTSSKDVNVIKHWRVALCVVVGGLVATLIWQTFFPHTFWFVKLWAGFATGATAGMFPGTWWQTRDEGRRRVTSGKFIAIGTSAWGLFALIAIFLIAPELQAQESERFLIRSLTASDISFIEVSVDGGSTMRIQDATPIASFVAHSKQAELFYPSHEGSQIELQIVIHRKNESLLKYDCRVPEHHGSDLSLRIRGYFFESEIIVPGGRSWLDSLSDNIAK